MYRIPINFRCFAGDRKINQFMREVAGWDGSEGIGTNVTVTITGNFADIPDMDKISEIGKIYMEEFNRVAAEQKQGLELLTCDFESFGAIEKLSEEEVTS